MSGENNAESVSYTHLDVYKRQAQMHLDMYTAMGFVATPLGYSEVYNAM